MPSRGIMKRLHAQIRKPSVKLTAALLLAVLLTFWPTGSAGTENSSAAAADSVVTREQFDEAIRLIDEKDQEIMRLQARLDAQQALHAEIVRLKDQRIQILEDTVQDALGSSTKTLLDRLTWGLAGYGLGRMAE